MSIKNIINNFLGSFGYQISKSPFSSRQIKSGHFGWLQNAGIRSIIDVGANEGQFINKISGILPDAEIYAFEPLKDTFTQLQRNTAAKRQIKIFNYALGDSEKETIIHRNAYSPSSSLLELTELHKSAFPQTEKVYQETIIIKVLDDVLPPLSLQKNILLKIDVQGFELSVLRGAEKILKETDLILIETSFVELYKDQPLFSGIYNFLTSRGFLYGGSFEQLYDERDGRILQADSIFIRNRA